MKKDDAQQKSVSFFTLRASTDLPEEPICASLQEQRAFICEHLVVHPSPEIILELITAKRQFKGSVAVK